MREKSKTVLKSNKYKFIFIHNYKVAGTSVRKALCRYESIIYWLSSNFIYLFPFLRDKTILSLAKHVDYKMISNYYDLDEYFTFGLVRNPWDWEVSKYFYMKQTSKHFQYNLANSFNSFTEYLEWRATDYKNQIDFFRDANGEIKVDYICKVEEIYKLEEKLKKEFDINVTFPRINMSKREEHKKYFSKKDIELVNEIHGIDIKEFNYTF